MSELTFLGKQLELIDSIVRTTSGIIPVLRNNIVLTETIKQTIAEIFRFFSSVIEAMPEILIADLKSKKIKHKLIYSICCVRISWDDFESNPEEFFDEWAKMADLWQKYRITISELENTPGTMFISMN